MILKLALSVQLGADRALKRSVSRFDDFTVTNRIQKAALYRSVPKAAALLVIISVINFVVMLIRGYLAELEIRNSGFSISGGSPYRSASVWLIVAAVCLISTRFWILLVSIVTSGWVLYVLSYARWTWLARNAYESPIFSWLTTERILRNYLDRLDIVFELVLASSILICGLVLLSRLRISGTVRLNASG